MEQIPTVSGIKRKGDEKVYEVPKKIQRMLDNESDSKTGSDDNKCLSTKYQHLAKVVAEDPLGKEKLENDT